MAMLDVRPLMAAGDEPFDAIMAAVAGLAPGEPLELIAPLEPVPLYGVLAGRGFDHETRSLGGGDYQVVFRPEAPDVGELILEEHRSLLPEVEGLAALATEAPDLDEPALRRGLESAVQFLDQGLLPHAAEEERSIYPAVEGVLRAVGGGTRTMSIDHRAIAAMATELGELAGGPLTALSRRRVERLLYGLSALVEVHLTKENEVYLPLLDGLPAAERAALHDRLTGGSEQGDHSGTGA